MRIATEIVFRRITAADFFNIYKAPGQEPGGGGQSYIDVDTSGVSVPQWRHFLQPSPETQLIGGPAWDLPIRSLGSGYRQTVKIGQRRPTSVSIRAQKIYSARSNRVRAWHPDHTPFPRPAQPPTSSNDPIIPPLIQGLVIYIIRDTRGEFWAGWFKARKPLPSWEVDIRLQPMFTADEGFIRLEPGLWFDEMNIDWPFTPATASTGTLNPYEKKKASPAARAKLERLQSDDTIIGDLFNQDEVIDASPQTRTRIQQVRKRNIAAVKKLKQLYKGQCQITGAQYIFEKTNGEPYTEAHHLVPLGKGGADSPLNLIIISAHVHRMLHLASVSTIDPSQMKNNKLPIVINGKKYTITWDQRHAEAVRSAARKQKP